MASNNISVKLPAGIIQDALDQLTPAELERIKRRILQLQNHTCGLLRLPQELRNQIYWLIMSDHLKEVIQTSPQQCISSQHIVPKLFRASQQLRSQGLSLF